MMTEVEGFVQQVIDRNPGEREFHQAVREVAESLIPFINGNPQYKKARILERMCEPDRIICFRVTWVDDGGDVQINRAFRVQFNNAIGPYKGGLRFDPSVNQSILKFLGFEQTFKNSLTTLPMGGGKGGSDFDPKGKSDNEVMRFCQALMTELYRHIGPDTDVPAGDIGVGAREIGYLFAQYKRLTNSFNGVLTGKGILYGGSHIRPEATGYGSVYFAREMLASRGDEAAGKTCVVSGSGNVAQYTAEKLLDLGAKVVAFSDRSGYIHIPNGVTQEQLDLIIRLKTVERKTLADCPNHFECTHHPDERPWVVPCDLAFPSATENELDGNDAKTLLDNGCFLISEGANMPSTPEAVELFRQAGILYGPGKAANAGGVAISGLEMAQNAMHITWTRERVDTELQNIMRSIHETCMKYGKNGDKVDYVHGANIGGFIKVADSMLAHGVL